MSLNATKSFDGLVELERGEELVRCVELERDEELGLDVELERDEELGRLGDCLLEAKVERKVRIRLN